MKLKRSYSAREVAAMTGLTARQLQWWDSRHLLAAAVASHRTPAGGFTERRYSPVDVYELVALADLRRRGFTLSKIRQVLAALDAEFGVRLFDALGDDGPVTLLTDGGDVYARLPSGDVFSLLRSPGQPLLVVGGDELKGLNARLQRRRRRRTGQKAAAAQPRRATARRESK